ncbi:response regulator [Cytophagales bacterium LB-30]|uniref:Response regulator n=1 Tax=Shiella aurantiaca TaxID=3058365 RepID=A0ABT8F277_9BACT|nr:response regulator [Shiella aurantiaca]MDN4164557.1 response regulator [Shiella aurantiaca]
MDSKCKVLYIDDEKINLLVFMKVMEAKFDVLVALSGAEGLEILEKEPDVTHVISDMKMPEMSGLEFVHEASKTFPDKRFYLLSGFAIDDEIQEALDSKLIISYFTKPADYNKIEKVLVENN